MEVVFLCCINFLSSKFEQKTLGQMLDSAKALKIIHTLKIDITPWWSFTFFTYPLSLFKKLKNMLAFLIDGNSYFNHRPIVMLYKICDFVGKVITVCQGSPCH